MKSVDKKLRAFFRYITPVVRSPLCASDSLPGDLPSFLSKKDKNG